MTYMTKLAVAAMLAGMLGMTSCSDEKGGNDEPVNPVTASGLFIVNEGNYGASNSSLSFYDPATKQVRNNVFAEANGMKLGQNAQSMTLYKDKAWIVVNGSQVIFAVNPDTFKEVGRIENIGSPRYIHFVNDNKAYVTQLNDNRIYIVDPSTYRISGSIDVPGMALETGSTEQMVRHGKYVYVSCWSYQKSIIKIDTETDRVVDSVEIGLQPQDLVIDKDGDLWTITDGGGWEGNPIGYEEAALWRIDSDDLEIEAKYTFTFADMPSNLKINGKGDRLYWLNGGVWTMDIDQKALPAKPLINNGKYYYGLTINPVNNEIYVSDAIDYMQQGMVYRFSAAGQELDSFYAGIIPGSFCWK